MTANNACVADLLDTMHHEMDIMVCSHYVYVCVVASNRTTHPEQVDIISKNQALQI